MTHRRRSSVIGALGAMALIAASCSSSPQTTSPSTSATLPPAESTPTESIPDAVTLMSGTVLVEAAQSFDDPGFHRSLSLTGVVPANYDEVGLDVAGSTIVISLWDATRPGQTCDRDHPLSGCVTIDWSDSPNRPHVPPSGVFDNQITLTTQQGPQHLYLSETGSLNSIPDQFSPG